MAIRRVTWGEARRHIYRVCKRDSAISYIQVYKDWKDEKCQLWALNDLYFVTRVDGNRDGKALVVCLMAGEGLDEALKRDSTGRNISDYVDLLAKGYNCETIKVIGRKGWQRALQNDGYQFHTLTLVKRLKKFYNFINSNSMTNYGAPFQWRRAYG